MKNYHLAKLYLVTIGALTTIAACQAGKGPGSGNSGAASAGSGLDRCYYLAQLVRKEVLMNATIVSPSLVRIASELRLLRR